MLPSTDGAAVPSGEHVVVMDANALTGRRGGESTHDKVMGAYTRDMRNNGRRLMEFTPNGRPSILNTFFSTPKRGVSYKFKNSNRRKGEYRLAYALTGHADLRWEGDVSAAGLTVETPTTTLTSLKSASLTKLAYSST